MAKGFPKGHKLSGSRKGCPNKATQSIREAFQKLADNNIDELDGWLRRVAQDNPKEALKIYLELAEYLTPKLSRSEVTVEEKEKEKTIIVIGGREITF
jgi:hypothetical protein